MILIGILLLLGVWVLVSLRDGEGLLLHLLRLTDIPWEAPAAFGTFHLAFFAICLLAAVFSGWMGMRLRRQRCDCIVFGAGCVLFIFEAYKQFYSFYILNDRVYDFGFLPLQLCSLPLYLFLLTPLLPEGRVKEALYRFLAFFCTMGGCLVMVYPAFYERLSLSVHTMLWHTVMICVGVLILFARRYGKSWRREIPAASIVFLITVSVATLLNVVLRPLAEHSPQPLNLLYMSPYERTYFVLIRDVQAALGWLPSLLCYILLFIFVGATLVFYVAKAIRLLQAHLERKTGKKEENI